MSKEAMATVVTTDKGTFDINGIAPIGTVREIAISKYSAAWMRPKNKTEEKKIDKYFSALTDEGAE